MTACLVQPPTCRRKGIRFWETEAGERLCTVAGSAYNVATEHVRISTTLVEQVVQSSESRCYTVFP